MFSSLLQNLGLGDNMQNYQQLKVKNADLYQGKEYIHYNDKLTPTVFKRLQFLQVSSIPGLLSISEAMTGSDSVNKSDTALSNNQGITTDIVKNENAFNKSLSEYASLQQNLEASNLYHKVDATVTATTLRKLADLNSQLIQHAKRINADMSKLNVNDSGLRDSISKQQTHLNDYIHTLGEQKGLMETVNGMDENTKLVRTANEYHYLMWFIVFITFLSLFIYILTSDLVVNTLLVIICLMVIYLLSTTFSQKVGPKHTF
jgi:hypothetical protein